MSRAAIRLQAIDGTQVSRDSASQVARATLGLRQMLLRGAFRPGQRIAEIPLSTKLGVSRTPLRLAFERLEHEGLVKALPHTGFTPSEFSINDIWDAIETRGILEGGAARLAAERLNSPEQLEPLRKINTAMQELLNTDLESFTQYLDLNEAFHLAVVDLASNQTLRRALEQVYKLPFASPGSRVIVHKTLPASGQIIPIAEEHHRAIVDAIEHREGARAESLAREHARLMRRNLEDVLADRTLLEKIPGVYLGRVRTADRA